MNETQRKIASVDELLLTLREVVGGSQVDPSFVMPPDPVSFLAAFKSLNEGFEEAIRMQAGSVSEQLPTDFVLETTEKKTM